MKRFIALLMVVTVCFLTSSVNAHEKTTLYSADGSEIIVDVGRICEYEKDGWYEHKSDVTRVMYAADGSETTVFLSEIPTYISKGWYKELSDVTKEMYAADGSTVTVFLSEVEAYKSSGWFENRSDIEKVMYAVDGREITVLRTEVEDYKAVGWFENRSDVEKVMYAADGREITVFLSQVEAFKADGWYESKSDVEKTLYSLDGREITVYLADVEAYKNVGWYEKQLKADPSKPMLALTFDDGPKASTTKTVLDTLEKYNARATFFVLGSMAKNNPSLLTRMDALECQIGNHTYGHPNLKQLSDENIASQIASTDEIVANTLGYAPSIVRPPYGSCNERVMAAAGKPFVLWSVDTLDWKYRDAQYVKDYVLSHAYDGAIILMHDIHESTAQAVTSIVPELIKMGYQLVTVEELAAAKGYTMTVGNRYASFK